MGSRFIVDVISGSGTAGYAQNGSPSLVISSSVEIATNSESPGAGRLFARHISGSLTTLTDGTSFVRALPAVEQYLSITSASIDSALGEKQIRLQPNAAADTAIGDYFVDLSSTQTLSGKTLTEPKFADLGFIADNAGLEMLIFDAAAGAVNEFKMSNAATGHALTLSASGGDANIDVTVAAKGTGRVNLLTNTDRRIQFDFDGATADKTLVIISNHTLERSITLPNATTTLVGTDTTDTLTNKSIDLANNTVAGTEANFSAALSDGSFVFQNDAASLQTLQVDGDSKFVGNVLIEGNLSASNATSITVADKLILLASGAASAKTVSAIAFGSGSITADNSIIFGPDGVGGDANGNPCLVAARVDVQDGGLNPSAGSFTNMVGIKALVLSGAHTNLSDGSPAFMTDGSIVTTTTASSGQVSFGTYTFVAGDNMDTIAIDHAADTITFNADTQGGGGGGSGNTSRTFPGLGRTNSVFFATTTGSIAFAGDLGPNHTPQDVGTDLFLFVSGAASVVPNPGGSVTVNSSASMGVGGDLYVSGALIGRASDVRNLDYSAANVKNAVVALADSYILGDADGNIGPYGTATYFMVTGSAAGAGIDPGSDEGFGSKTALFHGDIVTSGSLHSYGKATLATARAGGEIVLKSYEAVGGGAGEVVGVSRQHARAPLGADGATTEIATTASSAALYSFEAQSYAGARAIISVVDDSNNRWVGDALIATKNDGSSVNVAQTTTDDGGGNIDLEITATNNAGDIEIKVKNVAGGTLNITKLKMNVTLMEA